MAEISSEDEEVDELVIHKGKVILVESSGEDDVSVESSGEDDRSIELDEFEALDEEQQEYEALGVQEHTNSIDDDAALYYEDYVSSDDEDYVVPRGSMTWVNVMKNNVIIQELTMMKQMMCQVILMMVMR